LPERLPLALDRLSQSPETKQALRRTPADNIEVIVCRQAAAIGLLRHPMIPKNPNALNRSGRAAGRGTGGAKVKLDGVKPSSVTYSSPKSTSTSIIVAGLMPPKLFEL